jgi:hypothetical protein
MSLNALLGILIVFDFILAAESFANRFWNFN